MEVRQRFRLIGEQIEKIPLRHQHNLAITAPQVPKIDGADARAIEHQVERTQPALRYRVELLPQPQLVDQVEG